ncbi:MAG: hypothetical protein Q9178_000160 [Gyalolechia marmorata]
MVKLPSLREICAEELRLDDPTQKRLRADTKTFRAAWIEDNGGPDNVTSNRELALRFLTDGNAAVGVKPGSLLWQTSGLDPNHLQNILPRDDEIVLRGVERVFEKLECYARDKRKTHGRTTSVGGQTIGEDEDVSSSKDTGCQSLLRVPGQDDLTNIPDLVEALENNARATGRGERVDQIGQHPRPTGTQVEDKPSAHRHRESDAIWDPIFGDVPIPADNPKDKEYEPSWRLSDEPTRLPATPKEIERRNQLPPSQRSRESTLIPMEEALNCINKRKRNQCRKSNKSPGTAGKSKLGLEDAENVIKDTTLTDAQTLAFPRPKRDVAGRLFATTEPTLSISQFSPTMDQSAAKRQKLQKPPESPSPTNLSQATGGRPWPIGPRRPTSDNCAMDVTAPSLRSEREIPDSPSSVVEDEVDNRSIDKRDDRSRTYVSPTSPNEGKLDEEDSQELYDSTTRESSVQVENLSRREESVELGSYSAENRVDGPGQPAGGFTDLPPNIWILTPNLSWMCWNKASMDTVTLHAMSEEVKSHMKVESLPGLTMRISDRKENWIIVLRPDEELRHEDIKAMVKANPRIRDVYYSPVA